MESKYADKMIWWEYGFDSFQIGIQIVKPEKMDVWPQEGEHQFLVDTGYTGETAEILIPCELFDKLKLEELPKSQRPKGRTVDDREVDLRISVNKIYIPKMQKDFLVFITTFPENETEYLIGAGFLKKFRLLLDGPKNKACLLNQDELLP